MVHTVFLQIIGISIETRMKDPVLCTSHILSPTVTGTHTLHRGCTFILHKHRHAHRLLPIHLHFLTACDMQG